MLVPGYPRLGVAIRFAMLAARLFLLLLLLQQTAGAGAFDVAVTVGTSHAIATTCVTSLTSVTMDVCVAKQRFPFEDEDFLGLAVHLGGGSSILRIGGSDQNDFYYDMNSTQAQTFSAKTGGPCCEHTGSCSSCTHDCTMPAPYWRRIADFAAASKHRLVFGLVPDVSNATGLIVYVKFRQQFLYFGHFELDVRGYTQAQGAAFSCLRLKLADMVLI